MNKLVKVVSVGAVAAIVTLFVLLLSGLGITGYANSEGVWVTMTTVQLGVNEFGVLMVLAVFLVVTITGYVFHAMDKKW